MQVESQIQHKKIGIVVISILMLTSLAPLGFFEPVYADHESKILKIQANYPADVGFLDIPLPMRINDITNTIIFLSFSTPESADQSDTSRRWELLDDRTLRIFGEENTPSGNNEGNLIIYIVELNANVFDISTQQLNLITTASEAPNKKSILLPTAVNASRAFVLYNGLSQNASDTSWGSEEFGIVSLNNTHVDWELTTVPDTGTNQYGFSVVQINETGILVQRGTGILNGTSPDDEVTDTITPPIAVDRDHTIVLLTGRIVGVAIENADPDEVMVQVTINPSNDIVIHRDDNAPLGFVYEWQTISFPSFLVNVTHGEISMGDADFILTDTISPVRDMDRSFVFSGAGSPFGYGTGSCDTGSAGAMDRCMNRLILTNMDTVTAFREDDTGTNVVNYQVIQLLELEVPEQPQGINSLNKIIKINGTIPSSVEHDVTISPALTNIDKTFVFATFETADPFGDVAGSRKSYEIFNATTLRFFGNADPTITNSIVNFTATFVEFDSSSPIVVQNEFFNYPQGLDDGEKTIHMSPINTTGSAIITQGRHLTGTDSTIGSEEIDRIRILSSNTWGYDVENFQDFSVDDGSTVTRSLIVDFNENEIFSQRGQLTMSGVATASVTPSIPIIQNQTILLFSHQTGNADPTESADTASVHGTIDATGDIDFFRPIATGTLEINWELVSFPSSLLSVEHGIHHQNIGISSSTSTITPVLRLDKSFAIGTEGLAGYGIGSGDNSTDTPASFIGIISTVDLEDESTVRFVRGVGNGDFDIGFQVIEFAGQNFTQNITDVTSAVDTAINFDIFKLLGDISTVGDTVVLNVTTAFIQNQTDIVITSDNVLLNITKLFQESVPSSDNVIISKMATILINATDNTVTALDSVFILVQQIPVAPPTGGGSLSPASSSTPSSPVRLVGLSVGSLVIPVELASEVSSDFLISWFGLESEDVTLVSITPRENFQQFDSWFEYTTPELLNIESIEGFENRFPTDPRSNLHQATNDFTVIAPRNACVGDLQNEITSLCLNPILYEVELEFVFDVKGAEFKQIHTVQIDARTPDACDFICQLILFSMENGVALLAMLIVGVFIFGILKRKKKKVRTVHIIRSRDIDTLGNSKTARKFKNLKKK